MSIPDTMVLALGLVFLVALIPLVPTEPVLISCGVLASAGRLPLLGVIVVAAVGCVLSDLINYSIGRKIGSPAVAKLSKKVAGSAAVNWISARLWSYGESILVVARWAPGGGTIGDVVSGALRFPVRRFLTASILGCTLWSLYATLLGYFGGELADNDTPLAFVLSLGFALVISVPLGLLLRHLQRSALTAAPDAVSEGLSVPA